MKNRYMIPLLALVLALGGCGKKEQKITSLNMLAGGKTFAVPTGTAADQFVLKKFPGSRIEYYNNILECSIAVGEGKADAAAYDKPILKNIAAKNPGLIVLDELIADDNYGFAVRPDDLDLKNTIDQVLAGIRANGIYNDMNKRWFPDKGNPVPMPVIENEGKNGELRFGTAAVTEPMSFFDANKQIVGFDIEFASYIAKKLGKKLIITDMEFGAMIPALISGKVDMIGAGLSITDERAKRVLFSESYYHGGLAVIIRGGDETPDETKPGLMKTVGDISNKHIGVLMGSIHDAYARKTYPNAEIVEYHTIPDLLFALNVGKIDVCFRNKSSVKDILSKNPGLGILAENIFSVPIGAGFNKENKALRDKFNAFLAEIRSNGTYDDMVDRWMKKGNSEMPVIKSPKVTNGDLKTGIVSDMGLPFAVIRDGQLTGFDIELGKRFAAYTGKSYVTVDLPFSSMLASLSTQKIDIITSSLTITDERKKQIDFSDPYFKSVVCVLAKKKDIAAYAGENTFTVKRTFIEKISESFYSNIIYEKRYLHILNGLKITIIISILAALFGTLVGALVCYMRMSPNRILSGTAQTYILVLRGMPVLVLLMIIYYVVFASVNINPVLVAIIAFGLNFGAYVSEMFRTSIQSIDRGQSEAAIAGGFTGYQSFRFIILPQALRSILPVYKGEFISLVKMTSIVGYIAVQDLTKASDIIRSRTFDAFFPLLMVALIYFLIAWLLTWSLGLIEISVEPKRRSNTKRKEVAA